MGRVLKRVPLDFNWPIGETWVGYLCPYPYQECPFCDGSGCNDQTRRLKEAWYGWAGTYLKDWQYSLEQDEVDALWEHGRLYHDFKGKPTAAQVNEWAKSHWLGHDTCNLWICLEVRAKRLGFYGFCSQCDGTGDFYVSEDFKYVSETWEKWNPPEGEGYQLWETTSEGSPTSPVFKTLDELCEWAEENATTFADNKTGKENWKKMLEEDFVRHEEGNMIFI